MSKRQLTQFLSELNEEELRDQILDLYQRYKDVKQFYDFSFHPREEKRFDEAKQRIGREYFPEAGKKIRKRRSVAKKFIRNFIRLEADPSKIADLMLFNIEVAQQYYQEKPIRQTAFYNSILGSFQEAVDFIGTQFLIEEFHYRIQQIISNCRQQEWPNKDAFIAAGKVLFGSQSH